MIISALTLVAQRRYQILPPALLGLNVRSTTCCTGHDQSKVVIGRRCRHPPETQRTNHRHLAARRTTWRPGASAIQFSDHLNRSTAVVLLVDRND